MRVWLSNALLCVYLLLVCRDDRLSILYIDFEINTPLVPVQIAYDWPQGLCMQSVVWSRSMHSTACPSNRTVGLVLAWSGAAVQVYCMSSALFLA
jgi:hypothetical protein